MAACPVALFGMTSLTEDHSLEFILLIPNESTAAEKQFEVMLLIGAATAYYMISG